MARDVLKEFQDSFKGYHKDAPSYLRSETKKLGEKKKEVAKRMMSDKEYKSKHFGKGGKDLDKAIKAYAPRTSGKYSQKGHESLEIPKREKNENNKMSEGKNEHNRD